VSANISSRSHVEQPRPNVVVWHLNVARLAQPAIFFDGCAHDSAIDHVYEIGHFHPPAGQTPSHRRSPFCEPRAAESSWTKRSKRANDWQWLAFENALVKRRSCIRIARLCRRPSPQLNRDTTQTFETRDFNLTYLCDRMRSIQGRVRFDRAVVLKRNRMKDMFPPEAKVA